MHDPKKAASVLSSVKQQSAIYSFVGPQHQAVLNVGTEIVSSIAAERMPSCFVHFEPVAGSSPSCPLGGNDAVASKLKKIQNDKQVGEVVGLPQLKDFHTFN